jgi:lysophospholipid acyltransferase (LPLAT)-like uncharacterized protein
MVPEPDVRTDNGLQGEADASPHSAKHDKPAELRFTLRQRIALSLISWAGALAIRLIGITLRLEEGTDVPSEPSVRPRPTVYCFWHRCIFPACYAYRSVGMAIMISRSFDGEYIARICHHFGYRTVRGSSSRAALSGFRGMQRELEEGRSVVIPVDGPRGPRYVAKPGPVLMAQNAQTEIICFYVAVQRAWVLKSWDRMLIPKPFSRVYTHAGRPITVPADATEDQRRQATAAMEAELERVRKVAETKMGVQNHSANV